MKISYAAVLIFVLGGPVLCLPINSLRRNGLISSIDKKMVLGIDTSATMESRDKLEKVGTALKEFISNRIPSSTLVGMVKISSRSEILSRLVYMNEMNRKDLIEKIPKVGQGDSCVSCGLRKAIKVLGDDNSSNSSSIVVMTDADESDVDLDDELLAVIEASQVQVVVVVLSNGTELKELEKLTNLTNGFVRYIKEENIYSDFLEVLTDLVNQDLDNESIPSTTESPTLNVMILPSISTTHASTENSIETSVTASHSSVTTTATDSTTLTTTSVPQTTKLEDKLTTVVEMVNSMTSTLDINVSTQPSLTFGVNETNHEAPTNTISPAVEATAQWLYVGIGVVVVIVLTSFILIFCLRCRKSYKRPCPSRGKYAPVHGDQVRLNVRPDHHYA